MTSPHETVRGRRFTPWPHASAGTPKTAAGARLCRQGRFDNLRENGRIAVCFSRPSDHRSFQLKGRVLETRPCTEADRPHLDRYARLAGQTFTAIGIPARVLRRLAVLPCRAVRFRVEAVFVQTPGPGAGQPLGPAEAGG